MAVTVLAVCCGIGVSAGILGLATSLRARRSGEYRERIIWRRKPTRRALGNSSWPLRLTFGAVLAVLVAALTRWPAAAVFAGLAGIGLPSLVRMTRGTDVTARTEAIALWTELLRDTLAAASGLSQSIVSTAPVAPEPIRKEVQGLALRLSNGLPASDALRMFADEVCDPSADLVVCALMLAATARAQRLVDLLGALSDAMREEVAMRLRVESNRASARSGVRTIIVFSVGFVGFLAVVARSYLAPFGSATGQLAIVAAGAFETGGIVLMMRLLREPAPMRLLVGSESLEISS